jgi:predicted DNA binding CopG/RHH family protein
MKQFKKIPKFATEDEERDFWAAHDSTDYIDWSKAIRGPLFTNLKSSTKTISLRLPQWLLEDVRREANRRDVPYQSFMKQALVDHLEELQARQRSAAAAR